MLHGEQEQGEVKFVLCRLRRAGNVQVGGSVTIMVIFAVIVLHPRDLGLCLPRGDISCSGAIIKSTNEPMNQ